MGKWFWISPLLLAGFCFWQGFSGEGQAVTHPVAERQQPAVKTTLIRELQTGMRVIGDNPELADQQIEPLQIADPSRWRNLRLEMSKADDSLLKITLLRPVEWLELNEAAIGQIVELDLPELGAAGAATVLAIEPCPDIEPGHRPLITGTFEHTAANVIDLKVESETTPIGTTDNHPFWSEDCQEFVEAGELRLGETLRLADGRTTRVTSIISRAGPETVYNLEVSGEHVYHVGDTGVLVHNTYPATKNYFGHGNTATPPVIPRRSINGKLSPKQVERFADTYYDVVAGGKAYTRSGLINKISHRHGVELNSNQLRQVRHYLKDEVFSSVKVTKSGGKTFVDFGDYAPGGYTISQKHLRQMEKSVSYLTGKQKETALRGLHEKYLTNKYGVDMTGRTWHHMKTPGEFQRVPLGLHKLFSPHVGLATW